MAEEAWVDSIEDEGLKESLGQFESQEKLFDAIGYKVPEAEKENWSEGWDEDLKNTAARFSSREDAVRAVQDLRKRDSQVRVPGKEATDKEISAYRKAVDIPETHEGYEFPEVPEDEMTDELKASRQQWGERFHKLNVPQNVARSLVEIANEDAVKMEEAQVEADKEFVKTQEEALRSEWKGDFEKNKTFANRAFKDIAERAGLSLDDLTKIETKDGRFLMDRPEMSKLFAVIGREMAEGPSVLTGSDLDTAEDQIKDIRKQIGEAQAKGDSKLANKLFASEQNLIAKMKGNKPIVGSQGVAA